VRHKFPRRPVARTFPRALGPRTGITGALRLCRYLLLYETPREELDKLTPAVREAAEEASAIARVAAAEAAEEVHAFRNLHPLLGRTYAIHYCSLAPCQRAP
jgi:hypothetical protein